MSLIVKEKIPTFDFIKDNIYLGDVEAAESYDLLEKENIQIIINISNSRYKEYEKIKYHHFDINDDKNENILQFFDIVNNIIEQNKDKNILIHCMNSVSRSVSLVLNYLMKEMNLKDSFLYLKSKRKQYTKPNLGFIKQLMEKEKELYNMNSMKVNDFYK